MNRSDGTSAAIGKEHVVEQDAGIRLVDIKRALHRLRGQADLVAFNGTARCHFHLDPGFLNSVGIFNGYAGMIERKLPDLLAGLLGMIEPLGGDSDFVSGKGHGRPAASAKKSRCWNLFNMLSYPRQTDLVLVAPQNFILPEAAIPDGGRLKMAGKKSPERIAFGVRRGNARARRAPMREFSRSLPMSLLRAREAVMRQFRPSLRNHGLTEQQWRILRALDGGGYHRGH